MSILTELVCFVLGHKLHTYHHGGSIHCVRCWRVHQHPPSKLPPSPTPESNFMNKQSVADRGVTFPGEYLLGTLDVTKQYDWLRGARNIHRAGGSCDEFLKWTRTDPNWKESEDSVATVRNAWLYVLETTLCNKNKPHVPTTAQMLLGQARDVMDARAKEYDKPEGERSMAATVTAFNAVTKRDLSESEGWLFMSVLKMVRDRSTVAGHRDSCEDLVAYSSLYGEARLAELDKHGMTGMEQLAAQAVLAGTTFQSVYDSLNAQRKEAKAAVVCKYKFTEPVNVHPGDTIQVNVYKAENMSAVTEAPATAGVNKPEPRERMIALLRMVTDQHNKTATRFIVTRFGGAQHARDIYDDRVSTVIEAITRLYPNIGALVRDKDVNL